MGASKEKRRRQEERATGIDSKQAAREKEASDARRVRTRNYIFIGLGVVLSILILFFSSNLFYRTFDAVKIGTKGYSAPEYKYYYYDTYSTAYKQLTETYGEYAQYFMPDEEALKESTLKNMQYITMFNDEAKKDGYTLSDEDKESVESAISGIDSYAKEIGYTGINSYLAGNYGKGMNMKLYRQCMESSYIASHYYNEIYKSFKYTDQDLINYYNENKDTLDRVTYYYKFFDGSAVEDNAETEEDETITKEDAMAKAKEDAETFANGIVYEKFQISGNPTTSFGNTLASEFSGWLMDNARAEGDFTIIETEDGYYVICFVSRDNNDYNTVNVRHILIRPVTVNADDYDSTEDYQTALKEADDAAKKNAEGIYQTWQEGDATEESFAKLADDNSADSPEGGLYENVYKGQMVQEFEDWCFAPHETGDTGIVRTTYGYHIMYYIGEGENYQIFVSRDSKNQEDFDKWVSDHVAEDYDVRTTLMFKLAD